MVSGAVLLQFWAIGAELVMLSQEGCALNSSCDKRGCAVGTGHVCHISVGLLTLQLAQIKAQRLVADELQHAGRLQPNLISPLPKGCWISLCKWKVMYVILLNAKDLV